MRRADGEIFVSVEPAMSSYEHSAKKIFKKIKTLSSARKRTLGKESIKKRKKSLSSVTEGALGEENRLTAVTYSRLCRVPNFAEFRTLGTGILCRVLSFADYLALGKASFAECFSLPSAALSKENFCRIPDIFSTRQSL